MRVVVLVKATEESERAVMPCEKVLNEMGKFNEQLVKAGVMLAADGLHPTSKGKRVKFSGAQRTEVARNPEINLQCQKFANRRAKHE